MSFSTPGVIHQLGRHQHHSVRFLAHLWWPGLAVAWGQRRADRLCSGRRGRCCSEVCHVDLMCSSDVTWLAGALQLGL